MLQGAARHIQTLLLLARPTGHPLGKGCDFHPGKTHGRDCLSPGYLSAHMYMHIPLCRLGALGGSASAAAEAVMQKLAAKKLQGNNFVDDDDDDAMEQLLAERDALQVMTVSCLHCTCG